MFKNIINRDEKVTRALEHFIRSARLIRSAEYENSHLDKLDILLSDPQSFVSNYFQNALSGLIVDASRSFVALAAPSMEGKTQSDFVFTRVRPLYFVLNIFGMDIERSRQSPNIQIFLARWCR